MDHRRLSNKALGDSLGIAHTTVGRWLAGESEPQSRLMRRLASELGIDEVILTDDNFDLPEGTTTALYKGEYVVTPERALAVREGVEQVGAAKMWEAISPKLPTMLKRIKHIEKELQRIAPLEREVSGLRALLEDFI